MLKLELKFDEKKIKEESRYSPETLSFAIDKTFAKYRFRKEQQSDGTICYYGNGEAKDYGIFGWLITTLKDKEWFMRYLIKWLWYNSDDSENEEDYTIEDILYHYTNKESAA